MLYTDNRNVLDFDFPSEANTGLLFVWPLIRFKKTYLA